MSAVTEKKIFFKRKDCWGKKNFPLHDSKILLQKTFLLAYFQDKKQGEYEVL